MWATQVEAKFDVVLSSTGYIRGGALRPQTSSDASGVLGCATQASKHACTCPSVTLDQSGQKPKKLAILRTLSVGDEPNQPRFQSFCAGILILNSRIRVTTLFVSRNRVLEMNER